MLRVISYLTRINWISALTKLYSCQKELKIFSTLLITMALLSGCSEMQVIGNAAMRELRADGMNVEAISYSYNQKLAAREKSAVVLMAKATISGISTNASVAGPAKKQKTAKAKKVRGLWEMAAARLDSK